MTLEAQYMTLLVMSINGAVMGAVHDMYRVVLQHWRFLRWAGPIFDFAFWIMGIFLVFSSLMWANQGELRFYVFVVMLLGYVLYRIFFRRVVLGSTVGIILGIGYICKALYRAFLILVVRPLHQLWLALLALLRALDRLLHLLEKAILWPFTPLRRILFWIVRIVLRVLIIAAKPIVKPLEPFVSPLVKRLRNKIRPVWSRIRSWVKRGKGFWSKLTNWLLNRDDDHPKP